MRIALLAHMHHPIRSPFAGGLEAHTHLTAEHLVRRGHDVTVFAKEGTRTAGDVVELVPEDLVAEPADPLKAGRAHATLIAGMEEACDRVRAAEVDVVLNNSLSPVPLTALAGLPMVTVLHTPATLTEVLAVLDDPAWSPPPLHRWLSVSAANSLAWHHRIPNITVVPNGIELDRWRTEALPVSGRAVWSGRITEEKGLHLAIEAARISGVELHFAGPISDPAYFATQVEPRLDADTVYHGHLDHAQLKELLASAEVYLATPLWAEPFGMATVEAMAVGTPVAALLSGAMGEIVSPRAGDVAVHHTAAALADSVHTARRRSRTQVRAWARRFSADVMVETYFGVLRSVAERVGMLEPAR